MIDTTKLKQNWAIIVYPDNTLDAILDVIRADDDVTDKDALCEIFAAAYEGLTWNTTKTI